MADERDRGRPEGRGEERPRREDRPRRDDAPAEEEPKKSKKRGLFSKKKSKKIKKVKKVKKIKKEKKPKKVKVKPEKKVKAKKGKKDGKEEGEGGKKKGKKLPVMIALAVVLLGGGFFGMKMAGGGDNEPPPIMLGDSSHVINLGELLVNTKGSNSFLKANVLVHLADGTHLFGEDGGHGTEPGLEAMAPYIDAVRGVLSNQSLETLASDDGELLAKIAIAKAINAVYHNMHKEDGEEGHEEAPSEGEEDEELEHPEWHSQEGPVLIVYLTDYAWM